MAEKKEEATKVIKLNGGVRMKDKILGRGGSATVYLAKSILESHYDVGDDDEIEIEQSPPPPLIAVKSVPLHCSDDLFEECQILQELEPSPHIIQFLGVHYTEEEDEEFFELCLEYASGGSLHDRIQSSNGEGLDEMEVRCYTRSILHGLKHIHDQGFVHCDLKPKNILICENNIAKIADFGLSMRRDRLPMNRNYLFRGTVLYVAPEELYSQSYEPISDVWGLGCTVLEMLSGTKPWDFDPKIDKKTIIRYIFVSEALPMIPEKISSLAVDFLCNCFVRDTKLRWTPDMLLNHPFITRIEDDIFFNDLAKKLEKIEIVEEKKEKSGRRRRRRHRRVEEDEQIDGGGGLHFLYKAKSIHRKISEAIEGGGMHEQINLRAIYCFTAMWLYLILVLFLIWREL